MAEAKKLIERCWNAFCGVFTRSKPKIPVAINSLQSVRTHTNTPLFLMICSHMHFCVESLLISDSPPIPPPPLFLPFSYHLCVPGFVNISPLNLAVSFDRGPLLSELIPKEGNVKHRIYYWTTAQPGKPPRGIYISWPLSVSLVSSHTGRLWRCWGLGLTSACSCISIQIKRCKILHLA